MKVYVVSYGWMSDVDGIRPMTPRVYKEAYDARQFCAKWKAEQSGMKYPFAYYDEIEVE